MPAARAGALAALETTAAPAKEDCGWIEGGGMIVGSSHRGYRTPDRPDVQPGDAIKPDSLSCFAEKTAGGDRSVGRPARCRRPCDPRMGGGAGWSLTLASMGVAKTCRGRAGDGGEAEGSSVEGSISSRQRRGLLSRGANYRGRHRAEARGRDARGDAARRRPMAMRDAWIGSLT